MSYVDPITLLFASIFTSNILLANFLGTCSFIAISKDLKSANGLGVAVIVVLVLSTVISWGLLHALLIPMNMIYLDLFVYIIVVAAVVQALEMIIERASPALYMSLGIYLPLIVANCAILGVVLFMEIRSYDLLQSAVFGFGSGVGWWLAIIAAAAIRKKVDKGPIPAGLQGPGITLITMGFMAMAFVGFSGILRVQ
jgi:Na+-transporting NADH:ubiquinone oxidoreductase subunit E